VGFLDLFFWGVDDAMDGVFFARVDRLTAVNFFVAVRFFAVADCFTTAD
jgi:hypothetical protein